MNKKEIILPIELFDGRFTPEQIGVLTTFISYPYQEKNVLDKWENDGKFVSVLKELMEEKIITFENGQATVNIDKQQFKPSKNMHVAKAIQEIIDTHGLPENVLLDIQDLMEEIANESYCMGYQDGKYDYCSEPEPFTAYGKKEDY